MPQQAASPDKLFGSPRMDPIKILSKYEVGEKGTLHRMYAEVMEQWFIYCHTLGKNCIYMRAQLNKTNDVVS